MKETPRIILIASFSVLVLFLLSAGTYILVLNKERAKLTIKNNVSYTLPSGWKEETISDKEVILKSPDYEKADVGIANGIEVHISIKYLDVGQTLDSERYLQENTTGFADITDETLDSLPALRYHMLLDDVSHSLRYFTIKDNYSILVIFNTKDIDTEQTYDNQIDEILRNIHLK